MAGQSANAAATADNDYNDAADNDDDATADNDDDDDDLSSPPLPVM